MEKKNSYGNGRSPIVSVIIPVYNCIEYLGQAIDSVIVQNVPVEIIVVNDSPWQDLTEFIKPYQERTNLVLIVNEQDRKSVV